MEKTFPGKPYRRRALFTIVVAAVFALAAASALAAGALIDINSADLKTLESLPGVGAATAQEIVKGRPYKSVDDLANVKGIGKAKLAKIKPLVTVGGQQATQPPAAAGAAAASAASKASSAAKAAPKEQLESLPGIGAKKAQAIIDGRPYQKPEDIMKVKGLKQNIYDKIKDRITVQ